MPVPCTSYWDKMIFTNSVYKEQQDFSVIGNNVVGADYKTVLRTRKQRKNIWNYKKKKKNEWICAKRGISLIATVENWSLVHPRAVQKVSKTKGESQEEESE